MIVQLFFGQKDIDMTPKIVLLPVAATAASLPGMAVFTPPSSPYWWVAPAVSLFGIMAAAGIAIWSINTNRHIARTKATLDFIERSESSETYAKIRYHFKDLEKTDGKILNRVLNPETESDINHRKCIISYLNHYELIAIGIKFQILDERFYREWMRGPLIQDWESAQHFVIKIREKSEKAFLHFEKLANAFKENK